MKGYFTRLIGQTGINVGTGPSAAGSTVGEIARPIHLEEIRPVDTQTHEIPIKQSGIIGEDLQAPGGWEENSEYINTEGVERKSPEKRGKDHRNQRDRSRERDSHHREEPERETPGQDLPREIGLETTPSTQQTIAPLERSRSLHGETTAANQTVDKGSVAEPPSETGEPIEGAQAWSSTLKEVRAWVAGTGGPETEARLNAREERPRGFGGEKQGQVSQGPAASRQDPMESRQSTIEFQQTPGALPQSTTDVQQNPRVFRENPTEKRHTAEPRVKDYQLSIGTISLIVEGPREEPRREKPKGEGAKAKPGREVRGSRLGRHYIRI